MWSLVLAARCENVWLIHVSHLQLRVCLYIVLLIHLLSVVSQIIHVEYFMKFCSVVVLLRAGLSYVHSVHVHMRPHHTGGPATRQSWKLSCQSLSLRWLKCSEITTTKKRSSVFKVKKIVEAPPKQCTLCSTPSAQQRMRPWCCCWNYTSHFEKRCRDKAVSVPSRASGAKTVRCGRMVTIEDCI